MQTALFAAAAATPEPSPARITSVVRVDARTGRLVRVMDVSRAKGPGVPAVPDEAVSRVSGLVEETARNYGVDPLLVKSVIQTESAFRPTALSNKGAQGLMQLMPATARRFGVNDSFDPKENIEGGVKYLKYLQDLFQDDRLAIAAYNAGEGAVTKYNGVPPYKETTAYVEKVAKSYASSKDAAAKLSGVAPKAVPDSADSEQQEERHPSLKAYVDSQGHLHMTTE
jgi:soluble lytic murein transglycosylase-like protein